MCECFHLYIDDFAKNWLVKNLILLYKNRRENNKQLIEMKIKVKKTKREARKDFMCFLVLFF